MTDGLHTTPAMQAACMEPPANDDARYLLTWLDGTNARDLLYVLLQSMKESVCLVDSQGDLVLMNAQAERVLGGQAHDLLHRPFAEFIYSGDFPECDGGNSKSMSTQAPVPSRANWTLRRADGRLIRASGVYRPVALRPDERGTLVLFDTRGEEMPERTRVISGLHAVDQDQGLRSSSHPGDGTPQSNQIQLQCLAKISHELRTPLHAILGFASLAIEKWGQISPEKLLRYVTLIRESGDRLMRLVNALLDLSKLQARHIHLRLEATDFRPLVEQVTVQMESLWREKGLSIRWEHALSTAPVICDVDRVTQVVWNLLSNAVKFSPRGGTIFLSLVEDTLPAGRREDDYARLPAVRLSIRDQGEGIPPNECSRIFDPFVQASGNAGSGKGTGLGLAICREIVLAHGGTIWADNHPSGGTIFSVTLPQRMPDWLRDTGLSSYRPQASKQDQ